MSRFTLTLFLFWLTLSFASYFIANAVLDPTDSGRFVDHGSSVYATVTSRDAEDHQLIGYEYKVGNRSYSGSGHGGSGNPQFEDINIGEQVLIFYDNDQPQDSIMGYPQTDLDISRQAVWAVTIALPVFPTITIGLLLFLFGKRKKPLMYG